MRHISIDGTDYTEDNGLWWKILKLKPGDKKPKGVEYRLKDVGTWNFSTVLGKVTASDYFYSEYRIRCHPPEGQIPPSDPVTRPEPAVGQVWKDGDGELFVVSNGRDDKTASVFYEDMGAVWDLPIHRAVEPSDTYVGQFVGFRVKEAT